MKRTIFLVDMNAFFITCEMKRNPGLKGKPAAVAGDPSRRSGIILAANYEARATGVKTTMTIQQALKLCPSLTLVPPDHSYYDLISKQVMQYLSEYSPVIEQNSIDEAWIDMTGTEKLFGTAQTAARKIMQGLMDDLDLWCSIGISSNKFLAKMASEMKKPLGITELQTEDVPAKLWPLPVGYMYGVGQKTSEALNKLNIFTIEDLAKSDRDKLLKTFGKSALSMHDHANGIDCEPVTTRSPDDIKSIGKSVTLSKDVSHIEEAKAVLLKLSDEVSMRARMKHKKGHTVQITLKYSDFRVITRQCQIPQTNLPKQIFQAGSTLLDECWNQKRPIRLIGIALTDFDSSSSGEQLSLFDLDKKEISMSNIDTDLKDERLQQAVDLIRNKFGKDIVSRASLMKKAHTESEEKEDK